MVLDSVKLLLLFLEDLVSDSHSLCPVKVTEHTIDPFLDSVTACSQNDALLILQSLVVKLTYRSPISGVFGPRMTANILETDDV